MDNILILMFIAILFVGALMLVIIATTRRPSKKLDVERYEERMKQIEALLERKDSSANHMAVINADKLLDSALKDKGVRGSNMGERLKNSSQSFTNLNSIWTAHKLRNRIAHEDNVTVSDEQARRALNTFRSGLRDLGALR
jgi:hypothetical protein